LFEGKGKTGLPRSRIQLFESCSRQLGLLMTKQGRIKRPNLEDLSKQQPSPPITKRPSCVNFGRRFSLPGMKTTLTLISLLAGSRLPFSGCAASTAGGVSENHASHAALASHVLLHPMN
jgi:hypothetical protein